MIALYWSRLFVGFAGVFGASGVIVAAAATHLLGGQLDETSLVWVQKATNFQLLHALALLALGVLCNFSLFRTGAVVSGVCFILGTFAFCGSLYALAATGDRAWAAVTPIGGFAFIVGWLSLIWAASRRMRQEAQT